MFCTPSCSEAGSSRHHGIHEKPRKFQERGLQEGLQGKVGSLRPSWFAPSRWEPWGVPTPGARASCLGVPAPALAKLGSAIGLPRDGASFSSDIAHGA